MTYREYKRWAEEYLQQARVLEEKIRNHKNLTYFESAQVREVNENLIQSMSDMRRDCLYTYKLLMSKAQEVREADQLEKKSKRQRAS